MDPTKAPPAKDGYPDPTKAPAGSKRQLFRIPFDLKLMLPIMTAGIIIVLILQLVIWISTKGEAPESVTESMKPAPGITSGAAGGPTGALQQPAAGQDTYSNGVMRFTFGPEWRLQTGNAPPNLGFATFTYEKKELGTVVMRVYNTLPASFIPPKPEEFYEPSSSYWNIGTVKNSQSTTVFERPVAVTVAGQRAMMQEYKTAQNFERAYYVPTDSTSTKYLLIISGVNNISPHKTELFAQVDALVKGAVADTRGHVFTDADGKYAMKLTYARPMQYGDRTFKLPLNGFALTYEPSNAKTVQDYLSLKNYCVNPQEGQEFGMPGGIEGLVFPTSKCSPLGNSELFVLRNGIAYTFTIADLPDAKRNIFPSFTFLN